MWRAFIRSPLTSFLTQLVLSLSSGLFFIRTRRDMIMGWFIQTATFVIFNKVCTSQVCAIILSLRYVELTRTNGHVSIAVFPLVYAIPAAHYPSPVMLMAFVCYVSRVLDGDTSIVAQPGVQSGIFGGTHFLSPVDLQYHLRRWTLLGTRGHCKKLPVLESEDAILTTMAHHHLSTTQLILRLTHLMHHYSELGLHFAFLSNVQRCTFLWSVHPPIAVAMSFRTTAWHQGCSSSGPRHHHALPSTC